MRKRKSSDSGHGSCSTRSKRRYKLEKDLGSVPHENVMENRKCTMSSMGTKDLQSTDSISIEKSKGCVTPSDRTPWNGDSLLGTADVRPPVKSTFMRKNIRDKCKRNHSIESFKEVSSTASLPVVQNPCSPDSQAPSDVVDKYLKNSKIPSNNCSYPVIGSTDGLTGCDKSHTSSHDVKITYTKKNKAVSRKGKDSSSVSKVTQETQAPGKKTFADNASLIETADVSAPSKNNVAVSISSNLTLVTNNESSSKKADDDIAQRSGIGREDCSNSITLEETSSKRCRKNKSRRKKKSLGIGRENCSNSITLEETNSKHHRKNKSRRKKKSLGTNFAASFSGISEMVSVLKGSNEASLLSKQASSVEKEIDAVTNSFADSKTEKMFPQINSARKVARRRRCRRKKRVPDNSRYVDTIKNNVTPNIDIEDGDSNKCANRVSPNKINLSPKISSNLYNLGVTRSIQGGKGGEKERSLSGFAYDIQQICSDAPCTFQPVAASVDANGSNRVSASDEFKKGIMEVKCDINAEAASNSAMAQKAESWLDKSGEGQQCYVDAVEGSLKLLPAGPKEGVSVPPSPIRGVVEELGSPNLPMKQNNWLDSCNEECASFSFQIEKKVLRDDSSMNHSGAASKLGIRDGTESVKLADDENNALDCKYKHTDASIGQGKEIAFSSMCHVLKDVEVTKKQGESLNLAVLSTAETVLSCSRKKLLVLDLNGLLADINQDYCKAYKSHKKVAGKLVFKRPFCDDFLKFCFERFHVGVWSSRKRCNVKKVVDYLMGNLQHKLLFCWDQSKCTDTGYGTVENRHKPLVLKELKKLWNKEEDDLPWEKGEYSPVNTLLVDDSPYKAICNPPHTAIFPYPYNFTDKNDNSLGPGGDLRVYLEGLAMADNVQLYVREHPFGQKAIADCNPSWKFYLKIIDQIQKSSSLTT